MPPIGPPGRLPLSVCLCALGALNLTCARPIAAGATTAGAPAAAAAGSVRDDEPIAPWPTLPKPMPTTEHTELRALGKTISRHVERGFETLVVSTGEHVRCEGDRLDGGAEVRIQGGADTRKPWSAWFASLPIRGADGNGASEESVLVVRRPLPARGEHQIAHVYLPQACNGTPEHFRFALPDAEPQATNSRALLTWADAFARHVGGSAWGEFATARVRQLYPEAPPKAVASPPDPGEAGRGPKAAKAKAAKAKGQGKEAAAAQAVAGRPAAGDAAAARALGAGAPDGHHHRDDVAAGDAADRPRVAGRRRRSRDRAAVGAQAAVFQAAPVGGDDGGARASGPVRAAGRVGARGVLLRAVPDDHAADPPARGAGRGHRRPRSRESARGRTTISGPATRPSSACGRDR